MGINLEFIRGWANHPKISEEQRTLILAALGAFQKLKSRKTISRAELTPIFEVAKSRLVNSSLSGGSLLAALAERHAAAQDLIRELMASRKSHERDNAVYLLNGDLPKSLNLEVLRLAVNDRCKTVRIRAAERCNQLGLRELIPALEQRIALETDDIAKKELEFHTAILRDGYLVHESGDELSITIRFERGLLNQSITKKDLEPKRLKAFIAKMRSESV